MFYFRCGTDSVCWKEELKPFLMDLPKKLEIEFSKPSYISRIQLQQYSLQKFGKK